jgi:hypothetical protein
MDPQHCFSVKGHNPDPRPSGAPDSSRLTALSQRRGRGGGYGGRMPRTNMGLEIIGARSDIVASLTGILDGLEVRWSRNLCKISESKFSKKIFLITRINLTRISPKVSIYY